MWTSIPSATERGINSDEHANARFARTNVGFLPVRRHTGKGTRDYWLIRTNTPGICMHLLGSSGAFVALDGRGAGSHGRSIRRKLPPRFARGGKGFVLRHRLRSSGFRCSGPALRTFPNSELPARPNSRAQRRHFRTIVPANWFRYEDLRVRCRLPLGHPGPSRTREVASGKSFEWRREGRHRRRSCNYVSELIFVLGFALKPPESPDLMLQKYRLRTTKLFENNRSPSTP